MGLLMSLVGMAVLLGVAVLFSENRRAINLRTVGGAFLIQFALGAFVLYSTWGQNLLAKISSGVQKVYTFGDQGIEFIFGNLVNFSVEGVGFIFAFKVLPTIIFFSSLIAVLYSLGIMQIVIKVLGGALQFLLGTSRAESMSASANIFVGQTEAPLVVRPFVPKMTRSELFAIMCGGLASVAGGVMAGYAAMGVPLPYLIAASFMAAPGGLLFAKILVPETDEVIDQIEDDSDDADKPVNVIDAAATGASSGLSLALNVGAMLLAFVGLIALLNGIISGIAFKFGYYDEQVTFAYQQLVQIAQQTPELTELLRNVFSDTKIFPDVTALALSDIAVADFNRGDLIKALTPLVEHPTLGSVAQGVITEASHKFTLELILGYAFAPVAWLIGVPWNEAVLAGSFIGQKTVLNEFVAYLGFSQYLGDAAPVILSEKTKAIISFALCGFANLSSIAILLGGLGGLAPKRRPEIAQMGMKAILAGTLSNLMAATIAGFCITLQTL